MVKHGRIPDGKRKFLKHLELLCDGREKINNAFKSNIFLMKVMGDDGSEKTSSKPATIWKVSIRKPNQGTRIKILTPKQILHRLPIALAQVKSGKKSEHLLNKIRQTVYFFYWAKEITKKTYSNITNSIKT